MLAISWVEADISSVLAEISSAMAADSSAAARICPTSWRSAATIACTAVSRCATSAELVSSLRTVTERSPSATRDATVPALSTGSVTCRVSQSVTQTISIRTRINAAPAPT